MSSTPVLARFELPWPPTVNHYYRAHQPRTKHGLSAVAHEAEGVEPPRGARFLTKRARTYRKIVQGQILAQRSKARAMPYDGALAVDLHCYPPDRRTRDLDDLPKGLLDALTKSGVWLDDGQIWQLCIQRCAPTRGIVVVTIKPYGGEHDRAPA